MMPVRHLPKALLDSSTLQRAMLFELAYSVAENLLSGQPIDWDACFDATLSRQRAYFDAKLPEQLDPPDIEIAELVGRNLVDSLQRMREAQGLPLVMRPDIPGFEWIANGHGDFAIGESLIEVKSTAKRFSASDYRQVAIYWLLSYASAIEGRGTEWKDFVLLNPRSGMAVRLEFDRFLYVVSSGRTKIDILQTFRALVGSRSTR
ncbi:hypothetical protein HNQ25_14390 [Pseudomonas sediminis]|uniref:Restriction endonuclease n=2 Tax=Pseudomonas sediminis TaxID=1691904 RepID=A0ABX6SPK8_9PSED|nr:hypothetical protein HNQ25_14390 [Pseudomonas sediminis]